MIDPATSVRLLLALVVLLYGYLVALSAPRHTRRLVLAFVGVVPFFVWILAPGALSVGEVGIPLVVRRVSLLAGGAAVALRYASLRARDRSDAARSALGAVGSGLLLVSLAVGSSNWLVTAAGVVSAFAAAPVSPSATSSGEARPPRPDRRGT
ncbi:MAG: hypothetical protein ACOC2D_05240 [Spirochaetota bacterium]